LAWTGHFLRAPRQDILLLKDGRQPSAAGKMARIFKNSLKNAPDPEEMFNKNPIRLMRCLPLPDNHCLLPWRCCWARSGVCQDVLDFVRCSNFVCMSMYINPRLAIP
jgi:hypothetical protein